MCWVDWNSYYFRRRNLVTIGLGEFLMVAPDFGAFVAGSANYHNNNSRHSRNSQLKKKSNGQSIPLIKLDHEGEYLAISITTPTTQSSTIASPTFKSIIPQSASA